MAIERFKRALREDVPSRRLQFDDPLGCGVVGLSSVIAPEIWYEGAPVFAASPGLIKVTLMSRREIPVPAHGIDAPLDGTGDGVAVENHLVGFLRTTPTGARLLISALEKALLLAEPAIGEVRN